ncbi:hypothetical protein HRbin35_00125 [bacterium HR35]|nr:hypothetical protein HRbin35_00125 [bacterium HR35]
MRKEILVGIIFLLIVINLYLLFNLYKLQTQINLLKEKQSNVIQPINRKTLEFLDLFVKKVLKADKEVDFETRLLLENKVRELQDKEILDTWNKFVNSKNETEAQNNVKDLLEILIEKSLK